VKSKLTICARAENRAGFFRDRGSSLPGAPPPGCVSGPRIGGETDELVRARIGARSREREATPVHRLVTLSASRPTATKDDDLADVAAVRPFSGPSTYLFPPLALFVLLVTSEQAVEVDGSSPQAACDGGFQPYRLAGYGTKIEFGLRNVNLMLVAGPGAPGGKPWTSSPTSVRPVNGNAANRAHLVASRIPALH
jgi:hypothetical protein